MDDVGAGLPPQPPAQRWVLAPVGDPSDVQAPLRPADVPPSLHAKAGLWVGIVNSIGLMGLGAYCLKAAVDRGDVAHAASAVTAMVAGMGGTGTFSVALFKHLERDQVDEDLVDVDEPR